MTHREFHIIHVPGPGDDLGAFYWRCAPEVQDDLGIKNGGPYRRGVDAAAAAAEVIREFRNGRRMEAIARVEAWLYQRHCARARGILGDTVRRDDGGRPAGQIVALRRGGGGDRGGRVEWAEQEPTLARGFVRVSRDDVLQAIGVERAAMLACAAGNSSWGVASHHGHNVIRVDDTLSGDNCVGRSPTGAEQWSATWTVDEGWMLRGQPPSQLGWCVEDVKRAVGHPRGLDGRATRIAIAR